MELREKILRHSMELMLRIGPQAVTMDMVARGCGISKRTLYETFPTKHNLIISVIGYNQQQANAKFTQIFEQAANSFEALMGVYAVTREVIQKTSPAFMADIKRLYPEAFEEYKAQELNHILSMAKIIRRAKDEGLVLPGIKCKIAAYLFASNMNNLHHMQDFPFAEYSAAEVFDGAFLNFMRGMATTRGQQIIEDYVATHLNQ